MAAATIKHDDAGDGEHRPLQVLDLLGVLARRLPRVLRGVVGAAGEHRRRRRPPPRRRGGGERRAARAHRTAASVDPDPASRHDHLDRLAVDAGHDEPVRAVGLATGRSIENVSSWLPPSSTRVRAQLGGDLGLGIVSPVSVDLGRVPRSSTRRRSSSLSLTNSTFVGLARVERQTWSCSPGDAERLWRPACRRRCSDDLGGEVGLGGDGLRGVARRPRSPRRVALARRRRGRSIVSCGCDLALARRGRRRRRRRRGRGRRRRRPRRRPCCRGCAGRRRGSRRRGRGRRSWRTPPGRPSSTGTA